MSVFSTKYSCDQITEDKIGGICKPHEGDEKWIGYKILAAKPEKTKA
jgi:hypothetical protein